MDELTTQQFVQQTGVPEGTLRMWERRHGFPAPRRLPGGHRRYSQTDVELVQRVARDRAAGITLAAAIVRATAVIAAAPPSVFATLRRRRPDLEPRTLRKSMLLALTHAIEDEGLARAQRPLVFASFQSEYLYRQSEARWRRLSRSADVAVVFADFARQRAPRRAPIEIRVDQDRPLAREWTLIFWAPGHTVCLSAWEPPARANGSPGVFEALWSVEPDVVHQAAVVCAEIASASVATLGPHLDAHLHADPGPPTAHQLRLAAAITNRTLSYLC
ncbi:MAG: DICT sensory domain-containing protein [Solirubrobacteraceae bacterium]